MVIEGRRLYLRPLTDATEQYLGWLHDPEVTRYLEVRHGPPADLQSLQNYIKSGPGRLFLAIILKNSNQHIGNIKLGHDGEVGLLIGEKDEWGRGYGSEAIQILTRHALYGLGFRHLSAGCYKENKGSRQAFLKAGWSMVSSGNIIRLGVWND